ncbi:MAG: hypothetical protein PHS93_08640 [Candidatus Omnitrophica bacterium]|jgi:uncharacterized protein (DUF4415 family)|nr:hypothetical protein [Candidatus Omnitrophota bacterium]MDD5551164.1 hypothetical protein [Candidatus Omnitrophota bacterium]
MSLLEHLMAGEGDENTEKVTEELSKLTSEEDIKAAKALILDDVDGVEPTKDTSTESTSVTEPTKDTSEKEDEKKESSPEEKELKTSEAKSEKEEKEPEKSETSIPKLDLSVIVTEEVINQFPEEDRKILGKYKDKPLSEYMKALVNSQRLVGKKAELLTPQKKEIEQTFAPAKPVEENKEVIAKVVDQAVIDRLRNNGYPDLPADLKSEEYRDYVARLREDDDPEAYDNYLYLKRNITESVKKDLNLLIDVNKRQKTYNAKRLNSNLEIIKTRLKEFGVDDPALVGYDLELKYNDNGVPYNELLMELLVDENENLDHRLVDFYGDTPIVKETALAEKFFLNKSPEITRKLIAINASKVIKEHETLKKENPTTLAKSISSSDSNKALTIDDLSKITDEKTLAAAKQKIMDSLGE